MLPCQTRAVVNQEIYNHVIDGLLELDRAARTGLFAAFTHKGWTTPSPITCATYDQVQALTYEDPNNNGTFIDVSDEEKLLLLH